MIKIGLLPTKKSIPRQFLSEYYILIFGEAGLGKTEFASAFPKAVMSLFEDGTKSMAVYDVNLFEKAREMGNIKSNCKLGKRPAIAWDVFKQVKNEFLAGGHDFKTMVIDTEDVAYQQAMEYVCLEGDYGHPSEKGYGAGWAELNNEYEGIHNELLMSPYGLVSISHAKFKEITDIRGKKRDKLVPSVGGSSGEYLINTADIIILYDKDEDGNRVLRLEGDKNYDAKQRLHFENTIIPAGNSGKEAFENFKAEFDKAVANRNKELGITKEMIDEYYSDKKNDQKMNSVIAEMKAVAKDKGISGAKVVELLQETQGVSKPNELDVDSATEFVEFLKEYEEQE